MAFFEPPPPPPESPEQHVRRAWEGPPGGVVGRTLALDLIVGRAEKAAVWIPSLTVYPAGFEFDVEVRHRLDDEQVEHPLFLRHHVRRRGRPPGEGLPPELLRLGVEFADGRKATSLDWPSLGVANDPAAEPDRPVMRPSRGGGGGGGRFHHGYHVWPLPPPGPLAFVCEWPAAGIELTRTEVAAEQIQTAAAGVVVLWDDEGETPSGSASQVLLSP